MYTRQKAEAPIAIIVALLIRSQGIVDASDKAVTAASTTCKEIEYNNKIVAHFESMLSGATGNATALRKEALVYQLAAAQASQPETALTYTALHALTTSRLQKQESDISKEENRIRTLIDKLRCRNANLKLLLYRTPTQPLKVTASGYKKPSDQWLGASDTLQCTLTAAAAAAANDPCKGLAETPDIQQNAAAEFNAAQEFPFTADDEFKAPAVTSVVRGIGDVNSAAKALTDGPACAENANSMGSKTTGAGIQTQTLAELKQPQKTPVVKAKGTDNNCKEKEDEYPWGFVGAGELGGLLCAARQVTIPTQQAPSRQTGKQLAQDPAMVKIANTLTGTTPAAEAGPEIKAKAAKHILEDTDSTIQKKFIDPLAEITISFKFGDATVEGNLKDLATGGDAVATLAYLQHQKTLRSKSKPEINAGQKTLSSVCGSKSNLAGCSEDDKCEWKGTDKNGECKPKSGEEGVKAEGNDGKTTNTTGSNSFVINKAPLWLAFLLF
uniref:Variant surface glycoprotein n=1 Tax=Trypanosoma brucei TaxID=5691 RepID=S5G4T7_9TRYP|nr:variant surface glycoprotein [Trypanosoma brucei]